MAKSTNANSPRRLWADTDWPHSAACWPFSCSGRAPSCGTAGISVTMQTTKDVDAQAFWQGRLAKQESGCDAVVSGRDPKSEPATPHALWDRELKPPRLWRDRRPAGLRSPHRLHSGPHQVKESEQRNGSRCSGKLSAVIVPPCVVAMCRATARPSPTPAWPSWRAKSAHKTARICAVGLRVRFRTAIFHGKRDGAGLAPDADDDRCARPAVLARVFDEVVQQLAEQRPVRRVQSGSPSLPSKRRSAARSCPFQVWSCWAAQAARSRRSRSGSPASASARARNKSASTTRQSRTASSCSPSRTRSCSATVRGRRRATSIAAIRAASGVRSWCDAWPVNCLCRSTPRADGQGAR